MFIEPRPAICGTARLSIGRIAQLRALGERSRIVVREAGDELEVSIGLDDAPPQSAFLSLPVRLGVTLVPEGAAFPGELNGGVELAAHGSATCRLPRGGLRAGSRGTLYLRFADALYERTVVVE